MGGLKPPTQTTICVGSVAVGKKSRRDVRPFFEAGVWMMMKMAWLTG